MNEARRFDSVSEAYEYRRNHVFFENYKIGKISMPLYGVVNLIA